MTTKINGVDRATSRRRLLKLADYLDTIPKERFDYGVWVDTKTWEGKPDLSCGTAACAMGWATTIPEFRRLGLRLDPSDGEVYNRKTMATNGFEAAEEIFGLEYEESRLLFAPGTSYYSMQAPGLNATAQDVAAHIREFVAARR